MERSIICSKAIQIFGLSLVLMTTETARGAITVFDTFGVGNAYDTGTRYGVDGNTAFQAFLFVPTSSGTLSDITVALGRSSATHPIYTIQLIRRHPHRTRCTPGIQCCAEFRCSRIDSRAGSEF